VQHGMETHEISLTPTLKQNNVVITSTLHVEGVFVVAFVEGTTQSASKQ
jgi:hypothetical protein